MKSVFDSSFRYRPSFDTDVRKTFERARREQQARARRTEDSTGRRAGRHCVTLAAHNFKQ